jgi:AcrR family transcriptional regulator
LKNAETAGTKIRTPWGPAAELKERRLHPSSGTPPAEVDRNQRERLFGALVAVASEKGYAASTVADMVEISGVSRSAFYAHFANKDACLAAAAEELIAPTLAAVTPVEKRGNWEELQAAFEKFIALICSQPAAARICFVELHAAGELGEAIADRGFESLAQMVEEASASRPGHERISPHLLRILIGGLRKTIHTRLYRGEESELGAVAPELWRWLVSVRPPPRELVVPRRHRPVGARFEGYTPAERIARAVAGVMAEKGYRAMNTDDVAARAGISLSTFYTHFTDKRDAVLGALEMSGAQIMALAVPAARRAGGWQEGVRALYEAICAYFVAEPEMAQLATVGVYGAGTQALARRDRVIDALVEMLAPGFEENPEAPPVSAEASAAAVYALMREQVRSEGPQSLVSVPPLATYITLVAFVGPERACAMANGEGRQP